MILKKNNTISLILIHLFFLAIFIVFSFANHVSIDAFFHLNMGNEFLKDGFSSWNDSFSFTFNDQHVTGPPYLFQSLLAIYVNFAGLENGFILLRITVFFFFIISLYLFYNINNISIVMVLITLPFITATLMDRIAVRPELFSYPLFVLCLIMYFKAQSQFDSRRLFPIALLFLFWVNYHIPIFGYIIIFGLFVEKGIRKIQTQEDFSWFFWCTWGLILFLIGFLNPEKTHFFFDILNFDNAWKKLVSEFISTFSYRSKSLIYPILFLSIIFTLYLIIKKQYGLFIASIVFTISALQMYRLVQIYFIFHLLVIAYVLSNYNITMLNSTIIPISKAKKYFFKALILSIIISGIYFNFYMLVNEHINSQRKSTLPITLAKFLKENGDGGNIFNQIQIGGYLSYILSPNYKVFIDGRTNILYPIEFARHYRELFYNSEKLEEEIKKYDIKYGIIARNPSLFSTLFKTYSFSIDYIDDQFILMRKTKARYPLSGLLMLKPACWTSKMEDELLIEIHKKTSFSRDEDEIKELQRIFNHYLTLSKNEKNHFIRELSGYRATTYDSIIRIFTFIAIEDELYQTAQELIEKVKSKNIQDYIIASYIYLKQENYSTGIKIINFTLNTDWTKKNSPYLYQRYMHLSVVHKVIILDLLYKFSSKTTSKTNKQIISRQIEKLTSNNFIHNGQKENKFNTVESLCLSDH
ncbi:MAG: hypothetical protein KZQ83_11955 [gamma proteobacterium symbiont of Taylorina sp.]|nr:hypothetical protein [gamma proteobacterium symbiont of Taylorina sp.]